MRDRLVHHYFDINLDVLWTTVTEDLPALLAVLPPIRSSGGRSVRSLGLGWSQARCAGWRRLLFLRAGHRHLDVRSR
jgi:hypothetical protein